MNEIKESVEYSIKKGAARSAGRGVLAMIALAIVNLIPGVPEERRVEVAGAVYVALDFVRNMLKIKMPRFFFWQ